MVLDFSDAFMGVPLADAEQGFNACHLSADIARNRGPAFAGEAASGRVIIWRVLGFGGKPNPLVFSRAASFAARTGQALMRTSATCTLGPPGRSPGRLQLYVDDPVLSLAGAPSETDATIDILLLWWLCLGPPLAWRKGSCGTGPHRWIGAVFTVKPRTLATDAVKAQIGDASHFVVVTVPDDFIATLSSDLSLFCGGAGHVGEDVVARTLGRCGRLAYLVPSARPFVSALWAAWGAAEASAKRGRREAPPGRLPTLRFATAIRWIQVLLNPPTSAVPWLPLEHVVTDRLAEITLHTGCRVEVDASPWGGGGVLYHRGAPAEYWHLQWQPEDAIALSTTIGKPAGQTSWELLAILVSLILWGQSHRCTGIALLGDNLASLEAALHLRGKGPLAKLGRELSWRRTRAGWRYAVGHLPTEKNLVADALSRLHAPGGEAKAWPEVLSRATPRVPPTIRDIWAL